MRSVIFAIALAFIIPTSASSTAENAHGPDCSGRGQWAAMMTIVHLKNAGLIDAKQIDPAQTKTVRLASEKIGKNLWRQVYSVTFGMKTGGPVQAIAIHDASSEECSLSGVEVFVVSQHLNPERR